MPSLDLRLKQRNIYCKRTVLLRPIGPESGGIWGIRGPKLVWKKIFPAVARTFPDLTPFDVFQLGDLKEILYAASIEFRKGFTVESDGCRRIKPTLKRSMR